jgi:hypothetical protein
VGPRQQDDIRRILETACGSDPDLESAVRLVFDRLREGAGEELLLEILAPLLGGNGPDPVSVARELLRIGVRPRERGWRRRKLGDLPCTICERVTPFAWSCPCGFRICQACLEENRWGMTCNNITWECPDCGAMRSF